VREDISEQHGRPIFIPDFLMPELEGDGDRIKDPECDG
jgi:hypothetical protein